MRTKRQPAAEPAPKRNEVFCATGLRRVEIWLPDIRSAAFRQKCERESLSLMNDPLEAKMLAQITKIADTRGWK